MLYLNNKSSWPIWINFEEKRFTDDGSVWLEILVPVRTFISWENYYFQTDKKYTVWNLPKESLDQVKTRCQQKGEEVGTEFIQKREKVLSEASQIMKKAQIPDTQIADFIQSVQSHLQVRMYESGYSLRGDEVDYFSCFPRLVWVEDKQTFMFDNQARISFSEKEFRQLNSFQIPDPRLR